MTLDELYQRAKRNPETGCMEWQMAVGAQGYGVLSIAKKRWTSHRLAWTLAHGDIPAGMCICHTCDNRRCINVEHLFIGTLADNVHDAISKGRMSAPPRFYGEQHHGAKLTEKQVAEIRARYRHKYGMLTALGKEYGVTPQQVFHIVHGEHWKEQGNASQDDFGNVRAEVFYREL